MAPIATTTHGEIEGTEHERVLRFAGVPFAKPPVGDLRFRPPQPPDRWDGVRPATSFADTCMQAPSPLDALLGGQPEPVSEDCLYLNVWTRRARRRASAGHGVDPRRRVHDGLGLFDDV